MTDIGAVVLAFARAQAPIVALTADRLYPESYAPPEDYTLTQGPALCFKVRGGWLTDREAILRPSVQFKCYGRTETEANQLYRALVEALDGVAAHPIRFAFLEFLGQTDREPETDWPYVIAFFTLYISNN